MNNQGNDPGGNNTGQGHHNVLSHAQGLHHQYKHDGQTNEENNQVYCLPKF